MSRPSRGAGFEWLAVEYPVLIMAVRQAIEVGQVALAWQLGLIVQTYQHKSGLLRDWAMLAEATLAAARQAGDHHGQVTAERSLAGAYYMLGEGRKALEHLRNVLALITGLGWLAEEGAFVERNLGEVLSGESPDLVPDVAAAIGHFERARELDKAMGHKQGLAYTLEGLAVCHMMMTEYESSIELLEQALPLHRELDDGTGEGYVFARIADNYLRLGRLDEAFALVSQALKLHIAGQHRLMQVDDLVLLGDIQLAQRDSAAARRTWQRALALAEQTGASTRIEDSRKRLNETSVHG